jgi:hypothetical protein
MASASQRVASPFEQADMGQPMSVVDGCHMTAMVGGKPMTGGPNMYGKGWTDTIRTCGVGSHLCLIVGESKTNP